MDGLMKPDERAKSILNNAYYFTGNKNLAKELSLWMCELFGEYCNKVDDKIYWKLVSENIYLL
jgi:hypothetical protein